MANISNINDFFVVDSAGLKAAVGADLANGNGSPYVGTDFTVVGRDASSPVANLWLSNFTHKSYILISDNSSNFIIRDSAAGNRLTIDTDGNSTFAGNVTSTGLILATNSAPILEARSTSGTQNSSLILTNIATLVGAAAEGLKLYYSGSTGNTFLDSYYSTGSINFRTKVSSTPITALSISADGNATFARKVTINITDTAGVSSLEALRLSMGQISNYGDGVYSSYFYNTSTEGARIGMRTVSTSGTELYFSTKENGGSLTQKMVIDTSGNVGIGNTSPSSFNTLGGKQVVIGDGTQTNNLTLFSATTGGGVGYGHIAFADSNTSSSSAQYAGLIQYYHGNDSMQFYTDATPRMTILNSGNVGIGTTTPIEKLNIWETTSTAGTFFPVAISGNRYQADYGVGIAFRPENNSGGYANKTAIVASGGGYGYNFADLHFCLNQQVTTTDEVSLADTRMIIKKSGNVGIGTTGPQALLDVSKNNSVIYDPTDDLGQRSGTATIHIANQTATTNTFGQLMYDSRASGQGIARIVFLNGGSATVGIAFVTEHGEVKSEKMRITSAGKVLIGRTDTDVSTNDGIIFNPNGEAYSSITTTGANTWHVYDFNTNNYRFFVSGAGQIYATSTSISAISDVTLKENIKPLETGLDEVMKLKPRRFDWKNGDGKNIAGFVAQEVEEILPDLVSDYKYNDNETKKSLKMGDMIPTLVKAIQELKAEIEILKNK